VTRQQTVIERRSVLPPVHPVVAWGLGIADVRNYFLRCLTRCSDVPPPWERGGEESGCRDGL
jgi:hypothetical protein